jgi:hypothetical protein
MLTTEVGDGMKYRDLRPFGTDFHHDAAKFNGSGDLQP